MIRNLINFLLVALVLNFGLAFSAAGKVTYKIVRLNTPEITIGGKQLKIGDTFSDTGNIKWSDSKQAMEVKDVESGVLYKFSEKAFRNKGVVGSISDFFLRTSQGSGRDNSQTAVLRKSETSSNFPEKRIAFIIGNSNYENLSFLRNAQKDASDVADALWSLGFDVVELYEANYEDMMTGLNKFASQARNYDVALFYYAGHGLQYEGKNYLLPINFENTRKSELDRTLHADDVLQRMEDSGAPSQIIFIDACRNIPTTWTRSASTGLARMEGSRGSVIVFSTESGKTADDGEGENSPFAAALINNLSKTVSFDETLNQIAKDTFASTDQKQFPMRVGMLLSDFRFNPEGVKIAKAEATKKSVENATRRPERAEEPKHVDVVPTPSEPRLELAADIPNLGGKVASAIISGNSMVIELVLANRSNKPLNPYITKEINVLGYENETMAVTKDGTIIRGNDIDCTVGGNYAGNFFPMPPNVPVKIKIVIKGLNNVNEFAYMNICFREINPDIMYGIGNLSITNTMSNSEIVTQDNGAFTIQNNCPYVNVSIGKMYGSGNSLVVELLLTNKSAVRILPHVGYRENTIGFENETFAASMSGDIIQSQDIDFRAGSEIAYNAFVLPPNVPVKLRAIIKGISSPQQLGFLNICMKQYNPDITGGIGLISISRR
ncbi:MAG: caspase family protein [Muribaculaceae bacterium]|nr:caspase family protein [Muribaculaceae bacterium]